MKRQFCYSIAQSKDLGEGLIQSGSSILDELPSHFRMLR